LQALSGEMRALVEAFEIENQVTGDGASRGAASPDPRPAHSSATQALR
jgi:hypothetical protein